MKKRQYRHLYKLFVLSILLSSCAASYSQQQVASIEQPSAISDISEDDAFAQGFEVWLADFKQRAVASGIAKSTVNSALKIAEPIERIVQLDKKQPEKKQTMEEYLANVISDARIIKGRELYEQHAELLSRISAQYGVEPEFIVALWGLETGYGKNTGGFNVVSALATLAYEGRRREFFESELMSALLIIDQGHVTASDMRGSWAGAMGQCQFMPSSFVRFAVDFDGDGRRDIWTSIPDALATAANLLRNRNDVVTFGVNWYLNRWMKLQLNGIHEELQDPGRQGQDEPSHPSTPCRQTLRAVGRASSRPSGGRPGVAARGSVDQLLMRSSGASTTRSSTAQRTKVASAPTASTPRSGAPSSRQAPRVSAEKAARALTRSAGAISWTAARIVPHPDGSWWSGTSAVGAPAAIRERSRQGSRGTTAKGSPAPASHA